MGFNLICVLVSCGQSAYFLFSLGQGEKEKAIWPRETMCVRGCTPLLLLVYKYTKKLGIFN